MKFPRRGLWHRDRRFGGIAPFLVLLVLVVLVPLAWLAWPVLGDPTDHFEQRRGILERVEVTRKWQTDISRYLDLTLHGSTGLQVKATIRRPLEIDEPRPAVILLGGYGTGRHAAELVRESGDLVIASISYPYQGPDSIKGMEFIWHFDEIQQAILDTTPAVLLTLEYLLNREYVDTSRVELIGVSFGAFFVSVPAVMDERISRVWLVQGAADPRSIYQYRMRDSISFGPIRALAARILGFFTATEYLKPERWVGRISPRPVVVINSHGDQSYPPASVAKLHASLREPFEIEWLQGEHITPGRKEVLKQLNDLVVKRIVTDKQQL
ncbi:MAG: hypothetical protein PVF21_00660 [Thiohalophilus sp.]|jgi:dienelactone hydrolase